MIGRLQGIIIVKQAPQLVIDVGGVGYEVSAPMTTFYRLPEIGERTTLFTHLVVREDAHLLYGFFDERDRLMFRELIKVNGVGPKLALTLLSGMDTNEFVHCVNENDISSLVRLPGVGKKTAERLIIEMRDRLKEWDVIIAETRHGRANAVDQLSGGQDAASNLAANNIAARNNAIREAEGALIALGYKAPEAIKAVKAVQGSDLSSEELIKMALKGMAK